MGTLDSLREAIDGLPSDGAHKRLELALRPLRAYDTAHASDLTHTLATYVRLEGNVAATAEALFLHRNSVLYRLQRITELSGLDVREPQTRGLLFVALALTTPDFLASANPEHRSNGNASQR